MKEKLEKILKSHSLRRNLSWFWGRYVTREICSYAYFMNMLDDNGRALMRDDIKKIILDFINIHEQDARISKKT